MNINSPRRRTPAVFAIMSLIAFSCVWIYLGGCPLIHVDFDISYTKAKNIYVASDSYPFDTNILDAVEPPASTNAGLGSLPAGADANRTLGIASDIYVVHLPHRTDRRQNMERLRRYLNLEWTYVNAVPSNGSSVRRIIDHLKRLRQGEDTQLSMLSDITLVDSETNVTSFIWPSELDIHQMTLSEEPLGLAGSDLWSLSVQDVDSNIEASSLLWALENEAVVMDSDNDEETNGLSFFQELEQDLPAFGPDVSPLTCATQNSVSGPPYIPSLPPYMILTPAKVSCWHSHIDAIRRIADEGEYGGESSAEVDVSASSDRDQYSPGVGIVLEDDIDMERDIHERLTNVWSALPSDWDIVFLGHCWSNESYHPSLTSKPPRSGASYTLDHIQALPALHPSFAPKCTHAYALSHRGARRLLLHLRHPPFAYSRALDQAFAWLVLSGRVKAFSVVPSVVVQRKMTGSDIDQGIEGYGSRWKDQLIDGVLGAH